MKPPAAPGIPTGMQRRRFLTQSSLALLLAGCQGAVVATDPDSGGDPGDTGDTGDTGLPCPDPQGTLDAVLAFVGEDDQAVESLEGQGHDGRWAVDLETLDPADPYPATFFVRTLYPDTLDPQETWVIDVDGVPLGLPDLPVSVDQGAVLIECSGNGNTRAFGLMSAGVWGGVRLLDVLDVPDGKRVLIQGYDTHSATSTHSTPGCSWIFTADDLERAFLATRLNGQDLPRNNGWPIRLVVPGWFGCACVKWVNRIAFVDDDAPATDQMREFASRTHQVGVPALARDYAPARIQIAAMPIRVERWTLDSGDEIHRVIGILWGGTQTTDRLQIRFGAGDWQDVEVCPAQVTTDSWTLWSHTWIPQGSGITEIRCRVDEDVPQVRLDSGFYARSVRV